MTTGLARDTKVEVTLDTTSLRQVQKFRKQNEGHTILDEFNTDLGMKGLGFVQFLLRVGQGPVYLPCRGEISRQGKLSAPPIDQAQAAFDLWKRGMIYLERARSLMSETDLPKPELVLGVLGTSDFTDQALFEASMMVHLEKIYAIGDLKYVVTGDGQKGAQKMAREWGGKTETKIISLEGSISEQDSLILEEADEVLVFSKRKTPPSLWSLFSNAIKMGKSFYVYVQED